MDVAALLLRVLLLCDALHWLLQCQLLRWLSHATGMHHLLLRLLFPTRSNAPPLTSQQRMLTTGAGPVFCCASFSAFLMRVLNSSMGR
jgi:hypothetical protein